MRNAALTGAMNLEPGRLKGDILLNLDTEDEYELCVGCAGGGDLVPSFAYTPEAVGDGQVARDIALTGLKGGHSGIDIILGLGNANKLMARFLRTAIREFGVRIVTINARTARNAIPRESFATVVLPSDKADDFDAAVARFGAEVKDEIGTIEPNFAIAAQDADLSKTAMSAGESQRFHNALPGAPQGGPPHEPPPFKGVV